MFHSQADNLRQQTLHQMHRILTVQQTARCFLAIGEYHNRLRALAPSGLLNLESKHHAVPTLIHTFI